MARAKKQIEAFYYLKEVGSEKHSVLAQKFGASAVKGLIEKGLAYPCFCSAEQLDETREMQEATKARIGYYGRYAVCRNIKLEDAYNKIKNGDPLIEKAIATI